MRIIEKEEYTRPLSNKTLKNTKNMKKGYDQLMIMKRFTFSIKLTE